MENLCISNLILIILNNKENSINRKTAELELKKRIKLINWDYNDLLHFDDKVIKSCGLAINNYLIYDNISMQKLMEVYFKYCYMKNEKNLLFSEKHLCNEADYKSPFFSEIISKEINNLDKRINNTNLSNEKNKLIVIKKALQSRKTRICNEDIVFDNDALYQLSNPKTFSDYFYDCDFINDLFNINFVTSDIKRLVKQQNRLIKQVNSSYVVDYNKIFSK